MSFIKDTIIIRGKEFPVRIEEIKHTQLKFFPDNPRIYTAIRADNQDPGQEEIEEKLIKMDYVKTLIQDIKLNEGLLDPIIVRDKDWIVLEGNSRLAAYRALSVKEPIKWGKIKCSILPADIEESYIFALLGQYHIKGKGKKDWAPYEQAGFLYRRAKDHNIPPPALAKELGLSVRAVNTLISTYEFMVKHNDNSINRWSYYEEYIKSRKIKKMREEQPDFDDVIVKKIKSGTIKKAVDIREKLPKLAAGTVKNRNKFVSGKLTLDEACEKVEDSGKTDTSYQKIMKFRNWLASSETHKNIKDAPPKTKTKLNYELEKLTCEIKRAKSIFPG